MSQTSEHCPSGTPPVAPMADGRPSPFLLPLNPLILFDLVIRSLLPRPEQPSQRPGGAGTENLPTTVVGAADRYTRQEAAERAGMAPADMGRLWRSLGFAELAEDSPGYTAADIDAFAEVAGLAADGLIDLDLAVSMARPMGHLLSRLGAAQVSALSGLVERTPGSQAPPSVDAAQAGADALVPLLERLVVYAWRRHLTAAASAALPVGRLDAASAPQTVGFIDIANYTALSRRIDWAELASLLECFEACVFDQVAAAGGRVVKTLGDEVLFVAGEPAAAAEIALSVMDAQQADPHLPEVHAGLAFGPLLERAGDVFGPTVNIASRVTGLARAGAVLVDRACRNELAGDRRFLTTRRPRRHVRGYAHLATYRLWRADPRATASSTATSSSFGRTIPTFFSLRHAMSVYR